MSVAAPIPGYYQVAYVTNDFQRALKQFEGTHGISRFLEMPEARFATADNREALCNIALAYVGGTEIEVIQPLDGDVQLYRNFLPEQGFAVRFHHLSKLHETEESLEQELQRVVAEGKSLPINGRDAKSQARYFYADYRAELGHYLENVYFAPASLEWLKQIPRN